MNQWKKKMGVAVIAAMTAGAAGAEEAAKVYAAKCAMCHGKDGKGSAAMAKAKKSDIALWNMVDETTLAKDDKDLIAATRDGVKPSMPAFKGKIDEEGIAALVAYIRSLGPKKETPPAKGAPAAAPEKTNAPAAKPVE